MSEPKYKVGDRVQFSLIDSTEIVTAQVVCPIRGDSEWGYHIKDIQGREYLRTESLLSPAPSDQPPGQSAEPSSPTPERQVSETGCVREKLYPKLGQFPIRLDLMFQNEVLMRRLAETYGEGALKYGANIWQRGFKESVYISHALEHIRLYMAGDKSEDHLAHAIWNFGTLMWVQEHKPELIDLTAQNEQNPK